jgi:molybdenum cofactor guanylyltransferase
MRFSGAVLTGGTSSRMGTDKAFVEVNGVPLAAIAYESLAEAGAHEILSIGGDGEKLASLGFLPHPDSYPGEGPLAGIIDAIHASNSLIVVILACDQPLVDASLVRRLVAAFEEHHDAVVPVTDGVRQPLAAAYSTRALTTLESAFGTGERSPSRAIELLDWRALVDVDPASVDDVDDPDDLARYARKTEHHDSS